jgi:prepilin-type N-terminal cleavage/methylation domain-containing protein
MRSLSHPIPQVQRRSGFSLVELLVSITIFVILATLSLSAFRDSKHDKVAAASRQLVASINGARSRAVKTQEPRGIRLIRDRDDPWLITGIQYIGMGQLTSGTVRVQINQQGLVQLRLPGNQSGVWNDLFNQGLLRPGARIRIPANEFGRWYVISSQGFSPATDTMQIVGLIDNANWNTSAGKYELDPQAPNTPGFQGTPDESSDVNGNGILDQWSNTAPIPYLIRLAPHELPDTEPINFPSGVVIDLLASQFPNSWKALEDVNQNGFLDNNENDGLVINGGAYPDDDADGILDEINFDIPVSPNGTVTGPLTGAGPIILYICARDDVERKQVRSGYDPVTTGFARASGVRPPQVPGDFENYSTPDAPSSERKLVVLIPQTGLLFISDVQGVDVASDGWADDPFAYARAGREGR